MNEEIQKFKERANSWIERYTECKYELIEHIYDYLDVLLRNNHDRIRLCYVCDVEFESKNGAKQNGDCEEVLLDKTGTIFASINTNGKKFNLVNIKDLEIEYVIRIVESINEIYD